MKLMLTITLVGAVLSSVVTIPAGAQGDQPKLKILFLCSGNSCRSQMGEAWVRHLKSDTFEAYSAGVTPKGSVDPRAIKAMAEVGVDISKHTSKHPRDLPDVKFDWVITVCEPAARECPVYPGAHIIHVPFDDPPALAKFAETDEEAMAGYRFIRDEIKAFVQAMPLILNLMAAVQAAVQ